MKDNNESQNAKITLQRSEYAVCIFFIVLGAVSQFFSFSDIFYPVIFVMSTAASAVFILYAKEKFISVFLFATIYLIALLITRSPVSALASFMMVPPAISLAYARKHGLRGSEETVIITVSYVLVSIIPIVADMISSGVGTTEYISEAFSEIGTNINDLLMMYEVPDEAGVMTPIFNEQQIEEIIDASLAVLPGVFTVVCCVTAFFISRAYTLVMRILGYNGEEHGVKPIKPSALCAILFVACVVLMFAAKNNNIAVMACENLGMILGVGFTYSSTASLITAMRRYGGMAFAISILLTIGLIINYPPVYFYGFGCSGALSSLIAWFRTRKSGEKQQ